MAFRGTEATNLLNWRTNLTINMTRHRSLGGTHDGALFTSLGRDWTQAVLSDRRHHGSWCDDAPLSMPRL